MVVIRQNLSEVQADLSRQVPQALDMFNFPTSAGLFAASTNA